MTPGGRRRTIATGETLLVAFQGEERHPLSDSELVEAVVCLANRSDHRPAWLLIGIQAASSRLGVCRQLQPVVGGRL